jgi:cell division protein ZapA (FtsZ GTPase activity inhibitor)
MTTLGPREIILHIGPPKAASTSIQQAARANRAELIREGVLPIVDLRGAVPDLLAVDPLDPSGAIESGAWSRLCREVATAGVPRVLISDEKFAWLDDASVHRVVEEFGRERLRVVIGTRSLERLIPSYWQELLKVGYARSLSEWCADLFSPTVEAHALTHHPTRFWRSEDVGAIAGRWAAALEPSRVHCFVIDETSTRETMRHAAEALNVTVEHLIAGDERSNRSLSAEEAVSLLALNRISARARLPRKLRRAVAHRASESFRHAHERPRHSITLPAAWSERVHERQSAVLAALATTTVTVHGDLKRIGKPAVSEHAPAVTDGGSGVTRSLALRWFGMLTASILASLVRRVRRRICGTAPLRNGRREER